VLGVAEAPGALALGQGLLGQGLALLQVALRVPGEIAGREARGGGHLQPQAGVERAAGQQPVAVGGDLAGHRQGAGVAEGLGRGAAQALHRAGDHGVGDRTQGAVRGGGPVGQPVAELVPEEGQPAVAVQQGEQPAADLQEDRLGDEVDQGVLRAGGLEDQQLALHAQRGGGPAGVGPGVRRHALGELQGAGHQAPPDPRGVGRTLGPGGLDQRAQPGQPGQGEGGGRLAGKTDRFGGKGAHAVPLSGRIPLDAA